MARETKAELAKRIASTNAEAFEIPLDLSYEDKLFGEVALVEKAFTDEDGWDMYTVSHSGHNHTWSSAVVVASFGPAARLNRAAEALR